MRHWDELARYEREGFEIIVDKTWEDIHPRDCFDDSVTDIQQLCEDIDAGKYDWFMLRTRVLFEGHELAAEYLGGCLYEDPMDVFKDGIAEDQIEQGLANARSEAAKLREKLVDLSF